ncbi:acyltransferase [Sinorhizobium glycinis]|uniref:Acyltransferase n=1 Tax=Sinorhizobium glycinis TaxID=1472378 RepID=A0A178XXV3_9HYPH|nr:acyltransferase [Sinorhizobium glycinis]OAP40148.1 acyltransferase [Sinorhizobium glycinis]
MQIARDRQLDGLRAIAVSLVLYAHFFAADGSHLGHIGVRLFFVLSGFLITQLLLEARSDARFEPATALKSFYARRALRIFPPYFAVLGFVWLTGLESSKGVLAWHALYLSNFWYALQNEWTPWVLCHTWSLSIEEQFYIVWPLAVLIAPRRSIAGICVGVIAFSLAYRFYWPLTGTPSLARDLLPPASMDALAAGGLLAVHRSKGEAWPQWARKSLMPLLAASLILLWLRPVPKTPMLEWLAWIGLEVFPLLPLAMLVGSCSRGIGGYLGRFIECPPMTALGRASYGIYLYHAIVLAFVVEAQPWIAVNVSEQGPGRLLIAGAGTLIIASISWLAFEKPLNALKRHFPYVAPGRRSASTAGGKSIRPIAAEIEVQGQPAVPRAAADRSKVFQTSDVQ